MILPFDEEPSAAIWRKLTLPAPAPPGWTDNPAWLAPWDQFRVEVLLASKVSTWLRTGWARPTAGARRTAARAVRARGMGRGLREPRPPHRPVARGRRTPRRTARTDSSDTPAGRGDK